jgi:RHH-type proline utilization regulon transcriptional repressor/proline dehydrogenase/delta 1-pyrroline-5-carboxylate dehydrogenase
VLQLLPGRGETVGAGLVGDDRVKGVMFTGSTEVARLLQRNIAGRLDNQGRPIPLIAETGGQNAMIVDSSALTEQVVIDVVSSAFDSAGQRCSALRVLCLQEDSADRVIEMLKGAMAESRLGNPERLSVDIGPVIDAEAKAGIEKHIQAMRDKGRSVYQVAIADSEEIKRGTFVMPTLIELESFDELQREIFGPVLHVVRYKRKDIDQLIGQINASGYGLTLGVHTRIDETIAKVIDNVNAGNVYVNRNIVGAVVGVQPFGGEGLSGTGPKAGGPLYLYRLLSTRPTDAIEQSFARGDALAPRTCAARGHEQTADRPESLGRQQQARRPERPVRAVRRAVAKRYHPRAGRPDRRAQQLRDPAARARAVPGGRRRRSADPTGGGIGGRRFGGMAGIRHQQGLVRTPAEGRSGADQTGCRLEQG